jgi:hypothetical protein
MAYRGFKMFTQGARLTSSMLSNQVLSSLNSVVLCSLLFFITFLVVSSSQLTSQAAKHMGAFQSLKRTTFVMPTISQLGATMMDGASTVVGNALGGSTPTGPAVGLASGTCLLYSYLLSFTMLIVDSLVFAILQLAKSPPLPPLQPEDVGRGAKVRLAVQ